MDQKNVLKDIYNITESGKFSEALRLLKNVKLTEKTAINIFISISRACYNHIKSSLKIDEDGIYNCLNYTLSSLTNLEEARIFSYIQALFHVIRYMCDKCKFEDLIKMEFIINPVFLTEGVLKSRKEINTAYQSVILKLCNTICILAQEENTTYNRYLMGLVEIILRANLNNNDIGHTLTLANKCLKAIIVLHLEVQTLNRFSSMIFKIIKDNLRDATKDVLCLTTSIFANLISYCIEEEEFNVALELLETAERQAKLVFEDTKLIDCFLLFQYTSALFPSNATKMICTMEKSETDMRTFKRHNKELFQLVLTHLEEPLHDVLLYYCKSRGFQVWCDFPAETILNILKFLEGICKHFALLPMKCVCKNNNCSLENNYPLLLKIGNLLSRLLKLYIDKNDNILNDFYCEIKTWLDNCFINLQNLKACNCEKWSSYYQELATHTYNIACVLYKQKNQACVEFFQCFLKQSLIFEGTLPKILNPSLNSASFNVVCEIYYTNQNWEKCMAFAAIYCLYYREKVDSMFQFWWIKPKYNTKDNSKIQQLTLVSIFKQEKVVINGIVEPSKCLTKTKKVELLSYELSRYKAVWKSKESIMIAFSSLTEIADLQQTAKVLLDIFGDCTLKVPNDMSLVFSRTKEQFQTYLSKKSDKLVHLALAVIHYYSYKTFLMDTVSKQCEEMEKTMRVTESLKQKFEPEPKDPNEECDIVSAYPNLKLSKLAVVLDELDKSLEIIGCLINEPFDERITRNMIELLIYIGGEYRLHCYALKTLQAYETVLRLAEKISCPRSQLLPLSFLIEKSDVKRELVKELIIKGDKLASELEQFKADKTFSKTLCIYYISKCKAFLYEDSKISYDTWKSADVICEENKADVWFNFIRAELHVLHYKLTQSCQFVYGEHERQPITFKLHKAYDIFSNFYKSTNRHTDAYEISVLFDVAYELGKTYYMMRLPREIRAYMKNVLLLSQEIVLPMRYISLLTLLAQSDLLTCQLDNCAVKLRGINEMLCLSTSSKYNHFKKYPPEEAKDDIESCTEQLQELILDLPQHTRQFSPASPSLVVESFEMPEFLSHNKHCMCFRCLSTEYRNLVMQKLHLNALHNAYYDKNEELVKKLLQGALTVYDASNADYENFKIKAKNWVSEHLIPKFDESSLEYYTTILYDYSFHLQRKCQQEKALKVNMQLIQLLQPKKTQFINLYYNALLQRISYLIPANEDNSNLAEEEVDMQYLGISSNDNFAFPKTPATKNSAATIKLNKLKFSTPTHNHKIKKVNLFASDDEENVDKTADSNTVATPKPSVLSKLRYKQSVCSTPLLSDIQTPKIQIFTDEEPTGSIRRSQRRQNTTDKQSTTDNVQTNGSSSRSRKKLVLPMPSTSSLSNTDTTGVATVNTRSIPVIVSSSTRTRGQLLTQKIKASSLKNSNNLLQNKIVLTTKSELLPKSADCDSGASSFVAESPEHQVAKKISQMAIEKVKSSAKKVQSSKSKREGEGIKSKKDLLSQFEKQTDNTTSAKSTGAIRKSSRNRVL